MHEKLLTYCIMLCYDNHVGALCALACFYKKNQPAKYGRLILIYDRASPKPPAKMGIKGNAGIPIESHSILPAFMLF